MFATVWRTRPQPVWAEIIFDAGLDFDMFTPSTRFDDMSIKSIF